MTPKILVVEEGYFLGGCAEDSGYGEFDFCLRADKIGLGMSG